jgi:hypothetical protein
MVINPGHDLAFGAVDQHQPADDVELPQLHRLLALPTDVALALAPPGPGLDQPVPAQDPVHAVVDDGSGSVPGGAVRASSWASRRGAHRGCSRRSSHTRVSTWTEA